MHVDGHCELLRMIIHGKVAARQSLEGCIENIEDKLCPRERNTLAPLICILKTARESDFVRRLMLVLNAAFAASNV